MLNPYILNPYIIARFFRILGAQHIGQHIFKHIVRCFSPLLGEATIALNFQAHMQALWRGIRLRARGWLGLAATALIYSFLTACSPISNDDPSLQIETLSLDDTSDKLLLEEVHALWDEEKGEEGDPYIAGKAAYDIAQITRDPQWSAQAIELLAKARTQMPQFSLTSAYLGSAHALAARDFPLRGLWQILPGPGFIRLQHVGRAKTLLNKAVEQDPKNPIVRLVRAATFINMPKIFVNHDTALADFELLAKWDENPASNVDFADELGSVEWRESFYSNYGEALSELDETERANFYKKKLASLPEEEES